MAEEEVKEIPRLWIPHDKDVWVLAELESHTNEVSSVSGESSDEVSVILDGIRKTVLVKDTHALDPTHLLNLHDLCGMSNLHEAPLLDMLRRRMTRDEIYTNTGSVLISINPYKRIDGLYETPLDYYLSSDAADAIATLSPHVYKIANNAYMSLSIASGEGGGGKNQSVVVSGESGAGKTEASKHVMNFLIAVNEADLLKDKKLKSKSPRKTSSETTAAGEHIKRVLLDSNAVLESFGNSKTVRNDNSSRFGKYIRLQYTESKVLVSAFTETFLLEKSRLTNGTKASAMDAGERNYHVFYGLFVGEDKTLSMSALGLDKGVEKFSILCPPSSDPFLSDDGENFALLCSSMRSLGVTDAELSEIWALLAVILHLGNAEVKTLDSLASVSDGSIAPANTDFPTSSLEAIADAFGVSDSAFCQAMTYHMVQLGRRGSVTRKVLSSDDVANNINALMKWLYSGLFSWLVKKINYAHCGHTTTPTTTAGSDGLPVATGDIEPAVNFIGILDIFGFEILKTNSFEQLCINFTNERLQQQFNQQVFVYEQIEYEKEGLNWSTISFKDNQNVIDLICKKPSGLLNVLEEHGFLNRKPDDKALLTSFDQMHSTKHACYKKPRFGNDSFVINHFAGSVTYTIVGFLEKNNDSLQEDLLAIMDNSKNTFLLSIMNLDYSHSPTGGVPLGFVPAIPEHLIVSIGDGGDGGAVLEDLPDAGKVKSASIRHSSSLVSSSFGGSGSSGIGKKMASAMTVSYHFRHQLDELMSTLRATHPHYIKCIKPNTTKSANKIMSEIVMEQLRYSGILEVVRIRREGYPTRTSFNHFYAMFEIMGMGRGKSVWKIPPAAECSLEQAKEASQLIASAAFKRDPLFFQMGHTKIFLKNLGLDFMRAAVKEFYADRARIIQRKFKTRRQARWFMDVRLCAIDIQKYVRCWSYRKRYVRKMEAVKVIQWSVVGKRLRKEFFVKCHMATIIRRRVHVYVAKRLFAIKRKIALRATKTVQRVFRGHRARKASAAKRKSYSKSQLMISKHYRGLVQKRLYHADHADVIKSQAIVRRHLCTRHFLISRQSCLCMQTIIRGCIQRMKYRVAKRRILLLQCVLRMSLSKRAYHRSRLQIILAQAVVRGHIDMVRYRKALVKCVVIQTVMRGKLAKKHYTIARSKVICLQNTMRMSLARKHYKATRCHAIHIQNMIRMALAKKHYSAARGKVICLQNTIRMVLARKHYKATRGYAICIQNNIRMALAQKHYKQDRHSIICVQSLARKYVCHKQYVTSLQRCVSVQALIRRAVYRLRFTRTRRDIIKAQAQVRKAIDLRKFRRDRNAIICVQSLARKYVCHKQYVTSLQRCVCVQALIRRAVYRLRFTRTRRDIIKAQAQVRKAIDLRKFRSLKQKFILVQAVTRKRACVTSYQKTRQHWILVQARIRRYLRVLHYAIMKTASKRIKICSRLFLRRLHLRKRIIQLHRCCETGDAAGVRTHLASEFFTDLYVRNKWGTYNTCLHTAAQFGQLAVIELLSPTPHEILQKDVNGNTALHHAAMLPNMETVKALERRLLMTSTGAGDTAAADAAATTSSSAGDDAGDSDDEAEKDITQLGNLGDKIKEGYLKKVSQGRWGLRQQKRWVELHEEHLIYFKNKGDKQPRGAIPLKEAKVKRHPAANAKEGPSFELFSEEISLKKKKSNASLLFVCENEKELQEWLIPLKVLIGIDSAFRTTSPVTYVNSGLRDAWLAERNAFGETPLHIACRFYNGACPFIRTQVVERRVSVSAGAVGSSTGVPSTPKKEVKPKTLEPVLLSPHRPQVPLVRVLQLAMWLVESGCDIDATNADGQTALHLAVQHRNVELVACLVRKGASMDVRDSNRSTPEYFANGQTLSALKAAGVQYKQLCEPSSSGAPGAVQYAPLLQRPSHMSGYSYLSMHFMKHSLSAQFADSLNFVNCGYDFFLSVSVVNRGGELVEAKQDIRAAMIVRDSYLWWACTWNMQTPLENFDDSCSIKLELCRISKVTADTPPPAAPLIPARRRSSISMAAAADAAMASGPQVLSSAEYLLDFATLDSGNLNIPFFTTTSTGVKNDHSFVQADCMLLRKSKSTTLDKFRDSVYAVESPSARFTALAANTTTGSYDQSKAEAASGKNDTGTSTSSLAEGDVDAMGVKDLRRHLAALGVSMAGMLEVSEFRDALRITLASSASK
jgi:myosin heavy subunit/ankyrin repeat protein